MATNQSGLGVGGDGRQSGPARPGSPAEVLMGLQLLRASTMATTRLQLALARQDRPRALSQLDLLIDVDAEIERLVSGLAGPDDADADLAGIAEWLAAQKAAIAGEKFSLACEIGGSGLVSPPDRLSARAGSDADGNVDQPLEEPRRSLDDAGPEIMRATPTGRRWILALATMLAILAVAAAAGLAGVFDMPAGIANLLR